MDWSGVVFVVCAACIGFREVFWPYSVRGDRLLSEVAEKAGGKELLGFAFLLGALGISIVGCLGMFLLDEEMLSETAEKLRSGKVILYIGVCSLATALAWITAILALFSSIGPTKIAIVDWGSMPVFGILLAFVSQKLPTVIEQVAGMLVGLSVVILLIRREFQAVVGGNQSITISPLRGVVLALISSFCGAIVIVSSAKLNTEGVSPICSLPFRIATTCLCILILFFFAQRDERVPIRRRFVEIFHLGYEGTAKIGISAALYSIPFLVAFYFLTETNQVSFAIAFAMIPIASFLTETYVFGTKPVLSGTEKLCFILFAIGIVLTLVGIAVRHQNPSEQAEFPSPGILFDFCRGLV